MPKPSPANHYHKETPNDLVKALERARVGRTLLHLWYGDPKSGRAWELPPVPGRDVDPKSHLSTGRIARIRGHAILVVRGRRVPLGESHIVKVEDSRKRLLWKHELFHTSPSPVRY